MDFAKPWEAWAVELEIERFGGRRISEAFNRLRAVVDQSLSDLQGLSAFVDDPTGQQMIDHLADQLGSALRGKAQRATP